MTQIDQLPDEPKYAQTLNGIAERVAFQLGDLARGDEYATFDRAWICARVADTLKWLQDKKPSLFATEKTITLQPGQRHKRPEGCDQLFQINEVIDSKGRPVPVCEANYKDLVSALRMEKEMPDCMLDFCIYHFAFNPMNADEFVFSPSVREPLEVIASCSDVSSFLNDPDKVIDCEAARYINMIVAYVVSQAALVDGENQLLLQISDQQLGIFRDLAPVRVRDNDTDR